MSSHVTDRHISTKLFHEKLSMLNDNLIKFLQKQHDKKPHADLTPTLNDYFKHLRALDTMYSSPVESDISTSPKPDQTFGSQLKSSPMPTSAGKTSSETTLTTMTAFIASTTSITTSTTPITSTVPSIFGSSKPALFGGFSDISKVNNLTNILSTSTSSILPTLSTSITSFGSDNLSTLPKTTDSTSVLAPKKSLKRSADTSSDEILKKQLFSTTSANQFSTFPPFTTQKTNGEITSTTTISSIITTTTASIPPFIFGSSKPSVNLFGGNSSFLSSTETTKENNGSFIQPTLFPLFSEKTIGETNSTIPKTTSLITPIISSITTTTSSTAPTFSFGLPPKPSVNLFGVISTLSSNSIETSKENNVFSVNKPPSSFPSFFSFEKITGGNTLTTTTTTSTNSATSTVSTFSFGSSSKPSLFGGVSSSLFPSSTFETTKDNNDNEDEADDKPEEFIPKDNFQPIVTLPSKVETKSGEENEEVLFEARCRLFRFDKSAKEYKTRGTGDLKILFNKQTNRYRCIGRSSEGFKLIANFNLFEKFKVEKKDEKPNCLIWRCKDSSESVEGCDETFLAKFRDDQTAQKFANKVNEVVNGLSPA
ncbi:hypothetical protein ACQ4LE_001400 [Meloidogyne hapla]|uniref:RanBD1 domain-containing protein n=1 Tax=Meloidogyne hapla TaxID=6305 RepID=A0A1I8C0F8_MELHA